MLPSDEKQALKARLAWITLYQQTQDAGLTCRRCGISRPTLRKWWRRFQEQGAEGLASQSRARKKPPEGKITPKLERTILELRTKRQLGPRSIQSVLRQNHNLMLSTATIWKILDRHQVEPLRKPKVPELPKRYSRPIPGERVQMDTCKVGAKLYQFTAIDDCTRMQVIGVYSARTCANAVHFLKERMTEEFPFPIQRVQTDRGGEFFGQAFQKALRDHCIKFRPLPPSSPHLNGKVERVQQTAKVEFWATADKQAADLEDQLLGWQTHYNWFRPHTSLNGKTPLDRACELFDKTPFWDDVIEQYDPRNEPLREREFALDQRLLKLKRSG